MASDLYRIERYEATVTLKNKPSIVYKIEAPSINDAAEDVRRQYSKHTGFTIKMIQNT